MFDPHDAAELLDRVLRDLHRLREQLGRGVPAAPMGLDVDASQLVTLDQLAALVHVSESAMRRARRRGGMPEPYRAGRGGRAALWHYPAVRPWLVEAFGMPKLPARFPA